ncbi:unnamed protein product [Strongylus vulgaris]|uniref:Uncharacterized protein n=1 Tax=Strongylus vulgaris TaxID=40348 RepID=A0A3P7J8Q2_STRVU|nr:unnamed protein product [Strongylus vulgaris]
MMKLVVLVALAATVFATWDGQVEDIPGVSAQNMEKLRELLTVRLFPPYLRLEWLYLTKTMFLASAG